MTLSMELLVMIVINVLLGGVYIGGLAMAIKFIEKQIDNLSKKQDRYNNIIERQFFCEQSLKSEHKRLDEQAEYIKELRSYIMNKHEHE